MNTDYWLSREGKTARSYDRGPAIGATGMALDSSVLFSIWPITIIINILLYGNGIAGGNSLGSIARNSVE